MSDRNRNYASGESAVKAELMSVLFNGALCNNDSLHDSYDP